MSGAEFDLSGLEEVDWGSGFDLDAAADWYYGGDIPEGEGFYSNPTEIDPSTGESTYDSLSPAGGVPTTGVKVDGTSGGGALTGLGSALAKGIKAGAKALGGGSGSGSGSDNSALTSALSNFPKSIPSSGGMMQAQTAGRGDGGAKTVGVDAVAAWSRVFSTRRARSDD